MRRKSFKSLPSSLPSSEIQTILDLWNDCLVESPADALQLRSSAVERACNGFCATLHAKHQPTAIGPGFGLHRALMGFAGVGAARTSAAVEWLCNAMYWSIAHGDHDAPHHYRCTNGALKMYTSSAMSISLVSMAKHCDTAEAVESWCTLLSVLTGRRGVPTKGLFASDMMIDALVCHCATLTTTASAVASWSNALYNIACLVPDTSVFATVTVRDALFGVAAYANTADAVQWLSGAISACYDTEYSKPLFAPQEMRDVIISLSQYANTPNSALWLSSVIHVVSEGQEAVTKKMFATSEMRSALGQLARYSTTPEAVQQLCMAMVRLTVDTDPDVNALFATVDMSEILVGIATAYATTAESLNWTLTAALHLFRGPGVMFNDFFGNNETKDLLLRLLRSELVISQTLCTTEQVLYRLTQSLSGRDNFQTPEVVGALVAMADNVTASTEAADWCSAMSSLATDAAAHKIDVPSAALQESFITVSEFATSSNSVMCLSGAISWTSQCMIISPSDFTNVNMRDLLIRASQFATEADAVTWVSRAISSLTNIVDVSLASVFATEAMRDAFIAMSTHATTPESIEELCKALSNVIGQQDESIKSSFATSNMRDALISMSWDATTSSSVDWLCSAICHLIDDPNQVASKAIFATEEMRDAIVAMSEDVETSEAAKRFAGAIWCITNCRDHSEVVKELFSTSIDIRNSLVAAARMQHNHTLDTMQFVMLAITGLVTSGGQVSQNLFAVSGMSDALVAAASLCCTPEDVEWFADTVKTFVEDSDASVKLMFANADMRDAIITLSSQHPTNALVVESLARTVFYLTDTAISDIFPTAELRDMLVTMAASADSPLAAQWVCAAIYTVIRNFSQPQR